MPGEKKAGYLSFRKVLTKPEQAEYVKARQEIERKNKLQKLAEYKAEAAYRESQVQRAKSPAGKISSYVSRGISSIRNFATPAGRQALYRRQGQLPPQFMQARMAKQTIAGAKTGKKGRPAGTVDKRYAAYGGVYGYRKYMAQQRRLEILRAAQQSQMSPEEIQFRQLQQQRQQQVGLDMERRTFPDSKGQIPIKSIQDEIDAATRIFD